MSQATEVIIKKITAALNWPDSIAGRMSSANNIEQKLTDNPDFPLPYPIGVTKLSDLVLHIAAAQSAITARLTNAPGTAAAQDEALDLVHKDCVSIMTMVQNKMDATANRAVAICQEAGYDVKLPGSHPLRGDTAKAGGNPGEIFLTGHGAGTHQWQMSVDHGTVVTPMDPTTTGKDHLTGLPSGQVMWFRNRQVLPHGEYGDWSQWVGVMVP